MSNVVIRAQWEAQVTHVIQPIAGPQNVQTVVPAPILIREHYPATTSRALGIFQIVCAVLGIIFAIMGIAWGANSAGSGYSIWCNAPVIVTGILGIIVANKRTSLIKAFLVMSIISICAMGLMCLIAIMALGNDRGRDYDPYYWSIDYCTKCVAVDAMILLVAILLAGSLLWSSIIASNCCQAVSGITVRDTHVQTGQPQYPPPPNAYQPIPPAPGYQPPAPPPEYPPPYAPVQPQQPPAYGAGYDNYGGNYPTK